ncbi:glutaredoxin 3 [Alphaproteobacteria bacterium]|nr:glutaredoxin 3 [Alphaproteobacteria bacterium]
MSKIEIYTTSTCPYCHAAKSLLQQKKVAFNEINVTGDQAAREKMTIRANGGRTVPQIFINDEHIGGCDDLYALDHQNKLDKLLNPTR